MKQSISRQLTAMLVVAVALCALQGSTLAAVKKPPVTVQVEGFRVQYDPVATPATGWGSKQESGWLLTFDGGLKSEKSLSYRGRTLAAGQHDVWIEKGKGEWYYLFIGDKENDDSERLRGMFKLYEQEEGVEQIKFELKLTRRGTKLKFTVSSGRSQGHGNFKIIKTREDEASAG